MKIELKGHDGFIHADNIPRLVNIVCTYDDGKQIELPYQADKTLSQLYIDMQKIGGARENISIPTPLTPQLETRSSSPANPVIEKNDIVKCVKIDSDKRLDPPENGLPEVGGEYRVFSIRKSGSQVLYYELICDKTSSAPFVALANEVVLERKAPPKPKKLEYFEDIRPCSGCNEKIALRLVGDKYTGNCPKCNTANAQERVVA